MSKFKNHLYASKNYLFEMAQSSTTAMLAEHSGNVHLATSDVLKCLMQKYNMHGLVFIAEHLIFN